MSMISAAAAETNTLTGSSGNELLSVAEALNTVLANVISLYLKTKNFHWHVSGPHFRDYHLLFDQQAEQILGSIDTIAERVRKIGAATLHSVGDVARRQTIRDNDEVFVASHDMLSELRTDNLLIIDGLRNAKTLAERAGDIATSSLIDDWTDAAEERVWFLFEASQP